MFWSNFISLCNSVNKAPNVVAAEVGVKSSGTVTGWKNGALPREGVLLKLADYFGVTVAELTGSETKKEPAPEGVELTDLQKQAMEFVLSLSDEELRQFIRIGRAMIDKD